MYHYSKQRGRSTISPKETQLFGPQFSLQASATAVNERPPSHGSSKPQQTQGILGSQHVLPIKTHELLSSAPAKRSTSSLNSEPQSQHSLTNGGEGSKPGDRVVFAESPSTPGVPIVYRTAEERAANPDRLNLDRRRLMMCPILEGEEQLRLLNYQHNLISRIEYLNGLRRLIFLDLYDNQIEEISGLNSLKSLRVLMLGKNRIRRIQHLDSLTKLDVLDLHGNQIMKIESLGHLSELRVLNLAGNLIEHVDNLGGMDALTELNLRRNRIRTLGDADLLPNLQRLFLSFNEIACFEDISCLADAQNLTEISLDGNPLSQESHYKQTVLRSMLQLRQLDMKRITEDERRIASVMARKEEEKKKESSKMAMMKERRRLAINNARRQWEVMQGSLMARTNRIVSNTMPELVASHVNNVANHYDEKTDNDETDRESARSRESSGMASRPPSAKSMSPLLNSGMNSRPTSAKSIMSDREWSRDASTQRPFQMGVTRSASLTRGSTPENGSKEKLAISGSHDSTSSLNVDYLAELEHDTLSLYGQGALEALDKNWGLAAAGSVTTINFKFIEFDDIAKQLHKTRARFPSVHTLSFNSTNISSLSQLNVLSAMRRLDSLTIDPAGNPITKFHLWKNYALFRLAHFALKKINDADVSASDIVNAEKFFGPLAHITTTQLPQSRLVSLLGETKRKQLLGLSSEDKARKSADLSSKPVDRTANESVGRAGLVYTSPEVLHTRTQEQKSRREFVHNYVTELSQDAMNVNQKRAHLRQQWPSVLRDMVRAAVLDMYDMNGYMKRVTEDLEKSKS